MIMDANAFDNIIYDKDDESGIVLVTINRPEIKNDYSKKMALKLVPPKGASLAVGLTKRALHRPLIEAVSRALDAENEGLNKSLASADFWEALAARKEKREPNFKGA